MTNLAVKVQIPNILEGEEWVYNTGVQGLL